jgi:hypothetical protein
MSIVAEVDDSHWRHHDQILRRIRSRHNKNVAPCLRHSIYHHLPFPRHLFDDADDGDCDDHSDTSLSSYI